MRIASSERKETHMARRRGLLWGTMLTITLLSCWGAWAFVRATTPTGLGLFWSNAQAVLNLQLGCPSTPLANFGPCWDDAAEDAAGRWNSVAVGVRFFCRSPFAYGDPCTPTLGLNIPAFSSPVFRITLWDWPCVAALFGGPTTAPP